MFKRPIPVDSGDVVERDGFVFADLLPARLPSTEAGGSVGQHGGLGVR
jgi:hypothetical protein